MKRKVILLIYFIFITILNIWILNIQIGFNDYCNIIFLNTNSYEKYGLNVWNFKYIISFYVFITILMNTVFSYINESSSFLNMVLYRKGKKKTIFIITKNNILILLEQYWLINIIIIILSIVMPFITIEQDVLFDWYVFDIYLLRIILLFFLIAMENFFYSLNNNFASSMIKSYIIIIVLIFTDITINSNLICFSNNIIYETVYLFIYVVIVNICYWFKVVGGGKND